MSLVDDWRSGMLPERSVEMPHTSRVTQVHPAAVFPLTIKDLLLSGTPETVSPLSVKAH